MNALTIIAVVRQMLADGSTDEQIANVLNAMGFDTGSDALADDTTNETEPALGETDTRQAIPVAGNGRVNNQPPQLRGGAEPTVKYQMVGQWTPAKLAQRLTGRKLQVASIVLANNRNGITKREILAKIQAGEPTASNGAVMSALAPLGSVMGIIKSVPIAGAAPRAVPAKPTATVRRPLRRG